MTKSISFLRQTKGAAVLPVVLVLGGVILEIAIVSAFVAYSITQLGLSDRLAVESISAARSGTLDAVHRVIRNKDFSDLEGYTVNLGNNRTAEVVVVKDIPTEGMTRVTSIGSALNRQRKIQADLAVNPTTGHVSIISFEEVNL